MAAYVKRTQRRMGDVNKPLIIVYDALLSDSKIPVRGSKDGVQTMPAIITHDTFGQDAYARHFSSIGGTKDEAEAFLLGNQGPDPLFYSIANPLLSSVHRLGNIMHKEKPNEILVAFKQAIDALDEADRSVGRAYALGFLGHYVLDSTMHPLVYFHEFQLCDAGEPGLSRADGNEVHACDDKRVIDPALKESALLTGVFNRLARSCFYGVAVKEGDESPYRNGCIPAGAASATVVEAAEQAALAFEQAMYKFETHRALAVCDDYLRAANKRWSDASKAANKLEGEQANTAMTQALVDAFTELRVATVLMHGIVPAGCELICEYFDVDPVAFFSWDNIFASTDEFVESLGEKPGEHRVKPLPPRFDFFSKHESQY